MTNKTNITNIKKLVQIMESPDEFRPSLRDPHWKKLKHISILQQTQPICYKITNNMLRYMDKYTHLFTHTQDADLYSIATDHSDRVAIIYLLRDVVTRRHYVGFTTDKLLTFIKLSLHGQNMGDKNVFQRFPFSKLTNLKFCVIEFVKYKKRVDIINRKNRYKRHLHERLRVKRKQGQ